MGGKARRSSRTRLDRAAAAVASELDTEVDKDVAGGSAEDVEVIA